MRVGIATGPVVIGDLLGNSADQHGTIGQAAQLAGSLERVAEPNSVVIAASTRQLVGNLFDCKDLGQMTLNGFSEPIPAWRVLAPSGIENRFEALRTATTPLIGRDEELELLPRRWRQSAHGEGRVVLLSGEPGIGKSRLAVELQKHLQSELHAHLRYFCSPHHQDSALYPIISQLQQAAGFRRDDTARQRLDKLEAVLLQSRNNLEEAAALIADLLAVSSDNRYPALDLTPQKRKEKTLWALLAQLKGLAAREPVLTVFEDVHWIDPTSLELLDMMVDRVPTLPVLLVIAFRPEFASPWIGRPHVTLLTLNRLPPAQRVEMITGVTGGKALPTEILDQIVDRTDGVPLFIEELTKSVVESGILTKSGDHYAVVAGPMAPLAIPTSLHASLLARLDRLAPARQVAQIGAVIGRSFSYELINAVAKMPQQKLDEAIEQLANAELIFRRGTPPNAEYTFKHALVQDAAYGTLLREPRRALHARIVEILESRFAEIAENQPELLARHCTEAGLFEKAAGLWGKAGHRSLERSALAEAIEQFTRALDQITSLHATPALRREQIKLQVALITPLLHIRGYAAPETRGAVERARLLIEQAEALGEVPENPLLLFSVLYGFCIANYVAFNGDALCQLAEQFLALAEKQTATAPLMVGHRLMGTLLWSTGNIAQGRAHFDQALALYDPTEHRPLATRFGQDVRVSILSFRSLALWMLGYPEMALVDAERTLKDARQFGQASTMMYALFHVSLTNFFCGNYPAALELAEELIILAREKAAAIWKGFGVMELGGITALSGPGKRETLPSRRTRLKSGVSSIRSLIKIPITTSAALPANGSSGSYTTSSEGPSHWARRAYHRDIVDLRFDYLRTELRGYQPRTPSQLGAWSYSPRCSGGAGYYTSVWTSL